MSFSSFKEIGSDTVLLVEGVNDVTAVQQLLRLHKRDQEIVVLPMGGNQFIMGGRRAQLAELQRLTKNVAVLIDSERDAEGAPLSPERSTFLADCVALGYHAHATQRRALENYLTEAAVQRAFGSEFHALGPHESLKRAKSRWSKSENWRAVREMALADVEQTDLGKFLASLP